MMIRLILPVLFLCLPLASAEDAGFTEEEADGVKYRLFDPKAKKDSYKLLVFLPGGSGDANFTTWCRSIYRMSVPDDFLAVQMIAPDWKTPANIWPSDFIPTDGMKTPIDEAFGSIVKAVGKKYELEKGAAFTFSWSSGGPASYLIAATQKDVKGHFIAMSVFREAWLPKSLRRYKGQRFFLYHSPEDQICRIGLARAAGERLKKEKAEVKFQTYEGGHGWPNPPSHFGPIREAFAWMTKD